MTENFDQKYLKLEIDSSETFKSFESRINQLKQDIENKVSEKFEEIDR